MDLPELERLEADKGRARAWLITNRDEAIAIASVAGAAGLVLGFFAARVLAGHFGL